MFSRITLAIVVALGTQLSILAQQTAIPSAGGEPALPAVTTVIIFLKDCSASYADLPPDTSQAFISQFIRLAHLSQQAVRVGVILFGGHGLTVLGDESGMPTAAYESLHQSVLQQWPSPDGGTPLEQAMERCLTIVQALPPETKVIVVLFSDGRPASGVLQPERYPEVREEMDRRLSRLQTKYQGNDPAFVQKIVSSSETAMRTTGTGEWNELYELQLKAEFTKTLHHAEAMKEARVRFVSVDYTPGIAELKQIHEAAGGNASDYVLATPPSVIVPKLHALGLTALPRIIVHHPKQMPPDMAAFDATWDVALDSVGEAAVITAVFEPPIADFQANAAIEVDIAGVSRSFQLQNSDSQLLLSRDSAGNVIAATVAFDVLPKDGRVTIRYTSPAATLHVPGCTIYTHLRMAKDLHAEFRPAHAPADTRPTFHVSPNQPLKFVGRLHSAAAPQSHPLASIEPVLRDRFNARETRITMREDAQRKHVFVSDEYRLAPGSYDVELNIILPSGARIVLRETKILDCQPQNEFLDIELPLRAGSDTAGTSYSRAHLDFGTLGDELNEYRIGLVIRSLHLDYPITVSPGVAGLVDENGTSPHDEWITFDRTEILLEPGRAERVVVTLRIPERIEEAITDGLFQGRLVFERLDLRQPMRLRRYDRIAGVSDDEPVEPVTFTLTRPMIEVTSPRGPRNAVRTGRNGNQLLMIPVSIWHPFARRVVLNVRHTSVLPRDLTTLAQATFVDRQGRRIPSVRLVLAEDCSLTQQIGSGASARYVFDFEIDDDPAVSIASGSILLSGPGLVPLQLPVEAHVRSPLLGKTIKYVCFSLAVLFLALAAVALLRFLKANRLRSGRTFRHFSGQHIPQLLEFTTHRGEFKVTVKKDATVTYPPQLRPQKIRANHVLPKEALAEVSRDHPCTIEADGRAVHLTHIYPAAKGHMVLGKHARGGPFDALAVNNLRRTGRRLAIAAVVAFVGVTLFHPTVLAASQWVLDVLSLS